MKDTVVLRQAVMDAYRTLLELVGKFIPPVKERPKPMPVPMPPVENPIPPPVKEKPEPMPTPLITIMPIT